MTNIRIFLFENFHFLVVKFSVYSNRHVFVMFSSAPVYSIEKKKKKCCEAKNSHYSLHFVLTNKCYISYLSMKAFYWYSLESQVHTIPVFAFLDIWISLLTKAVFIIAEIGI